MPVLHKGIAALANRLPKIISPKAHAIIDYVTVGSFGLLAYLFWEENKRAAIAATTCGLGALTNTLLTDFPGGVAKVYGLGTHLRIDMGLAATCASLPNLMRFEDEKEAKWFRLLGANITAVTGMTEAGGLRRGRYRRAA